MLLKDPLQLEPTPYEILNIDPSADAATVKKAMGPAIMARKYDMQSIQMANRTLLDPERRAYNDLLMYPVDKIQSVIQAEAQAGLMLSLENRMATAETWRKQLLADFPDFVLLHALALVWYWWAKYEADRHLAIVHTLDSKGVRVSQITRKDTLVVKVAGLEGCDHQPGSDCSNPDCPWHHDCSYKGLQLYETWEKAIAYMTLLIYTPKVWEEQVDGQDGVVESVCETLRIQFEAELTNLNKGFAATSASSLAGQFQQLLIDFETERKTASLMKGVRFTFNNSTSKAFSLGTGRLLMRETERLATVRSAIDGGLKAGKGSKTFLNSLNELQYLLSPFANIAQQLNRERWSHALDMINALTPEEQSQQEVRNMKVQALIGLGVQEMELGKEKAAIQYWQEAQSLQGQGDHWASAKDDIQREVLKRVAVLSQRDSEAAITLLEQVIDLVEGCEQLTSRLGTLYFSAGIDLINSVPEVLNESDRLPDERDVEKINRGIALLQKAEANGDTRATTQLRTARELRDQLDAIVVMQEVNRLREAAVESAKAGHWDQAASQLLTALSILPPAAPDELRNTIMEEMRICESNARPPEPTQGDEIDRLRVKAAQAANDGLWGLAVNYLEQAQDKCPFFGSRDVKKQIQKDLAFCLMRDAVSDFNRIAERVKDGNAAYYELAIAIGEAREKLERAKKLDPKNPDIQSNLDAIKRL